uniref:RING-type domain-containing protein n=1 Tax=Meloidogyne javanica TaxID=6303 RepID=A0A915MLY1_MELJA
MYNILGIEFEGLKRVLVEIDIPINGSSDFIKGQLNLKHDEGETSKAKENIEENSEIKKENIQKETSQDHLNQEHEEGETSKANENIEEHLQEESKSKSPNAVNKESTNKVPEEDLCPICLSKWSENPKPTISGRKCNHIFHKDCVYGWLESDVYPLTCPTCRQPYLDIKIPIQEPVFSGGTFFYEYQILLDQFPHTDYNSGNYFIQNQSSINDENILGYIYAFRPTKHPSLSKSVEVGFSRSKLATFDAEDIEENEEKKKEGIVIN